MAIRRVPDLEDSLGRIQAEVESIKSEQSQAREARQAYRARLPVVAGSTNLTSYVPRAKVTRGDLRNIARQKAKAEAEIELGQVLSRGFELGRTLVKLKDAVDQEQAFNERTFNDRLDIMAEDVAAQRIEAQDVTAAAAARFNLNRRKEEQAEERSELEHTLQCTRYQAAIQEAQAFSSQAGAVGAAKVESRLAEVEAGQERHRAASSFYRRRAAETGAKRSGKERPPEEPEPPGPLRVHLRAGAMKNDSRAWIRAAIEKLLRPVGGDPNKLSATDLEKLDELKEALRRAEMDIDSGQASDFLGEDDQ